MLRLRLGVNLMLSCEFVIVHLIGSVLMDPQARHPIQRDPWRGEEAKG